MKLIISILFLFSSISAANIYVPVSLGVIDMAVNSSPKVTNGIDINQLLNISMQLVWTGSPNGFLIIQRSNDIVQQSQTGNPSANVINWVDDNRSSLATTDYNTYKSAMISLANSGVRWVRFYYKAVSGTGSLGVVFVGKG